MEREGRDERNNMKAGKAVLGLKAKVKYMKSCFGFPDIFWGLRGKVRAVSC
jgi:hypothetical protein